MLATKLLKKIFRKKSSFLEQRQDMDPKSVFENIYKSNTWGSNESVSGPGSEQIRTQYIREEIALLLKEFNIQSMLDAPCGDFNWMRLVNLENVNYLGGDIVEDLIKENNRKYTAKNIHFKPINIITDTLPTVDLILCRDCLVHLSHHDIFAALHNFKKSGSKYLLTTHNAWRSRPNNIDIPTGSWSRLNLEQAPFNFPPPLRTIIEAGDKRERQKDKTLSLWDLRTMV